MGKIAGDDRVYISFMCSRQFKQDLKEVCDAYFDGETSAFIRAAIRMTLLAFKITESYKAGIRTRRAAIKTFREVLYLDEPRGIRKTGANGKSKTTSKDAAGAG